jgi:hypothetical protein
MMEGKGGNKTCLSTERNCDCINSFEQCHGSIPIKEVSFIHDGQDRIALHHQKSKRDIQVYYFISGTWRKGASATISPYAPSHRISGVKEDLIYDAKVAIYFDTKKQACPSTHQ